MTPPRLTSYEAQQGQRAFSAISKVSELDFSLDGNYDAQLVMDSPSRQRRAQSLHETPFDTNQILKDVDPKDSESSKTTVLYLAYGSNLSAETFRGKRKIQPISQVNVLVPQLELTFDLPGMPYNEPCFANTRYRSSSSLEKVRPSDYHKDRWHKGLVGVVYEVSTADYAKIIVSEGGGAGYQDIVVDCYELPPGTKVVNPHPTTTPFKAHTLFAPALPQHVHGPPPTNGGRIPRPDPSYAQASARYLKLITTGAEEHDLPNDYKAFLYDLRPFTITSMRQRLGRIFFTAAWIPVVVFVFGLSRLVADKKGHVPRWMIALTSTLFGAIWASYDGFFKKIFGDGERSQNLPKQGTARKSAPAEKDPLLSNHVAPS